MARPLARNLWLTVHRWLGLAFLLLLSLVGVTGSLNVYHRQFDEWLSPSFYRVRASGPSLPLPALLEKAQQADPEPVVTVLLPDGGRTVLLVHHRHHDATWRTSLDPASGEVLGRRDQTHALLPTIYKLHQELLLKDYWGDWLVGFSGLALTVSCLSGLYLWWPRPGKWLKSITLRREKRTLARWVFDLHRVLGFWSCLLLVVVALTGFYLSFPIGVRTVIRWASPVRTRRCPKVEPLPEAGGESRGGRRQPPPRPGPGVGIEGVLEVARKARPDDVPIVVDLPDDEHALWRVAMRPRSAHPAVGGLTQLWIDPWRQTVAGELSPGNFTAGEWFAYLQFPLHNGALAGEGGRFVIFLSGFVLPFFCLSGGWMWWNRRRLQQKAARKRRPATLLASG